jgi:hypothetical protein
MQKSRNPKPPVAITVVYRYQPPARAPIDAGKLVADNGKVSDISSRRVLSILLRSSSLPPCKVRLKFLFFKPGNCIGEGYVG